MYLFNNGLNLLTYKYMQTQLLIFNINVCMFTGPKYTEQIDESQSKTEEETSQQGH